MDRSVVIFGMAWAVGASVWVLLAPDRLLAGRVAISHELTALLRKDRLTPLERLKRRLDEKHTGFKLAGYLTVSAAFGMLAFLFCHSVLRSVWLSLPAVLGGVLFAERLLHVLAERRRDRFEEGNVRALRVMASCLRVSPSYTHAFEQVATSPFVPPMVRDEYRRVVDLLKGQVPLEAAMNELRRRTGSADVAHLAAILLIQRELGGDMAKTLDAAATAVLRRRQMQRRQRAAMSQLLAQVNVLSVMPFVFVIALYVNNPHHFEPLTQTLGGRLTVLGCFASILVGGEVIRHVALSPLCKGGRRL